MQGLQDMVKIEVLKKSMVLDAKLKNGWEIIKINEDNTYLIGLPVKAAYRNLQQLLDMYVDADGLKYMIQHLGKIYDIDISEYKITDISNIRYNHRNSKSVDGYTHYVQFDDDFAQRVNEYLMLFPRFNGQQIAKRFKRDEK